MEVNETIPLTVQARSFSKRNDYALAMIVKKIILIVTEFELKNITTL